MAEPPIPTTANDWAQEMVRAIVRAFGSPDESEEVNKVTQSLTGLAHGTYWKNREAERDEILKDIKKLLQEAGKLVGGSLGSVIGSYYGVNAIGDPFDAIASGGGTKALRKSAGDAVANTIFEIFDLPGVARGYLNRQAGTEEKENFARFIGLNWQIQMADLIAEIASKWVPWDVAGGVREIGDRIQKVLGLEDAQEEIMEPLMEKLIVAGLEKRFNRETLPVDLTANDATQALIRGYITPTAFKLIMDNEGVREDIRQILVNLDAKNLTEADFRDLYQRGVWTEANVTKGYRDNGYLADDAQLKTSLIIHDREWTLRKELLNVKETQFAHGILDEGSFRTYLATMDFTATEVDMEIEIAKGKASLQRTAKPKQITGTFNVAPWRVRPGQTTMMSWNIRNATDITISGIGTVGPRGERVITPDISQTYTLDASSDTDTERFEAAVQVGDTRELKRPTASFSASPGRITMGTPVELKWTTGNADSISIDGIGPVAESGALAVYPFLSTIYTLRATNAQGTTVRQDIVFVELPDFDVDKERRPAISFAVTPGVVKASQPQTELTWTITRADEGRLEFPDGSSEAISRNGARIFTATASGIFTLTASNLFGETRNQQAIIFQGAEETGP